ncbi:MAG: ribosome maturation factor [Bacteroidetes bacterium]|nr:ribosome maturation factor [Bacteroidota bacterium]
MTTVHEQIENFLNESLQGSDCFVVSFKVKPTNNYKIYLDSDTGFTLEKSVKINRSLRRMIEENELYPDGDFSLEVSSPGIDAPLVLHRQYVKNIGRSLEIELLDEEAKGITGKLIAVDDEQLTLEEKKLLRRHEKAPLNPTLIIVPIANIKTATVVVEI